MVAGLGQVDRANLTLYLHYREELVYTDSNETVGQWLLSRDSVSANALAICEEEDVRDCTASQWIVDTMSSLGDDLGSEDGVDGVLEWIADDQMTVNEMTCDYAKVSNEVGTSSSSTVVIVVVVTVLIMTGICMVTFWWMNREEKMPKERVYDEDVEVAPMTDGGVPVTTTVH